MKQKISIKNKIDALRDAVYWLNALRNKYEDQIKETTYEPQIENLRNNIKDIKTVQDKCTDIFNILFVHQDSTFILIGSCLKPFLSSALEKSIAHNNEFTLGEISALKDLHNAIKE